MLAYDNIPIMHKAPTLLANFPRIFRKQKGQQKTRYPRKNSH